ncbi:MAG: hypothetical protein JSR17_12460 [Proteobacteria bacterium]|nr:hypothetical protein [Pseudomonadota bacterium]
MATNQHAQYDPPWKNIINQFFPSFMEYCFPLAFAEIDWGKGYVPLDKEMTQIMRDAKTHNRVVDKLMKVYTKSGEEAWVLVHCEIQGQRDVEFPKRMFVYRYRLIDFYAKPVASFALLTDANENWRPSTYEESLWGSSTKMEFVTFKLLDFKNRLFQLQHSTNPFSTVIEAHLAALATKKVPIENRFEQKVSITRRLYDKGWKKADIINLYLFIDWILALPKELELKYHEEISQIEEEKKVEYISTAERIGIEKGIQQGIDQTQHEERKIFLILLLKKEMGKIPQETLQKIESSSNEELKTWITDLLSEEASASR